MKNLGLEPVVLASHVPHSPLRGLFSLDSFSSKPGVPGLTEDLAKVERGRGGRGAEPGLGIRQLPQAQAWMGDAGSQEGARRTRGGFESPVAAGLEP